MKVTRWCKFEFPNFLNLAFRWDALSEQLKNFEKSLGMLNTQWNIYQDLYSQLLNWIQLMEKNVQQDRSLSWTTLPELRAKLFREKVIIQPLPSSVLINQTKNFLSVFFDDLQTMLQELSSRKRSVENFKEKADSVTMLIDSKNMTELSNDVISRYEALVGNLIETVVTNEKCLEDVQLFQNNLKQFRGGLKQQWETLSSYTGLYPFFMYFSVEVSRCFYLRYHSTVFYRFDW